MLGSARRFGVLAMAGIALAAGAPAFPATTSGVAHDPYGRHRPKRASKYPWSSDRQDSRRFETVVGRNGHATIRRVA